MPIVYMSPTLNVYVPKVVATQIILPYANVFSNFQVRRESKKYCHKSMFSLPQISLAIFSTYVLSSPYNVLDADKAFVTRAYISTLNFIVSMLPLSVSFLGQVSAQACLKHWGWDKMAAICWRHFQTPFFEWKWMNFD